MLWLLFSVLCWFYLGYRAKRHCRNGFISRIPYSIRGCGGDDEPEAPAAPTLPTAEELYASATKFGQENYPLAYGAREGALADLAKGTDYYASFQPTSFEDALSNQYFQNVWPDTERQIKQALSLSGIASSPVLADQLGKSYGNIATTVGEYLSDLGNERAQYSLSSRLGIDPYSTYGNYLNTDVTQSTNQANLDYQAALSQYQSELSNYQNQSSAGSTLGTLGGLTLAGVLSLLVPGSGIGLAGLTGLETAGLGGMLGGSLGKALSA